MQVSTFEFPGLVEITPKRFEDERGYFHETFNKGSFELYNIPTSYHQDNESMSKKGVLRGLHFQKAPYSQGKLVRVITGSVLDVVVDLRHKSPTFKRWKSFNLDGKKGNMVYVPKGFAHGFYTLEDNTIFLYKCTAPYNKAAEGGVRWDDKDLNIDWKVEGEPILAERDVNFPLLQEVLLANPTV